MSQIQLVDPHSGAIFLAQDEQTAQAQMSAYGLQVASPEQISAYDKTKDAGAPGDIPPEQVQPAIGNAPPPAATAPPSSPVPSVAAGVPIVPGPQPVSVVAPPPPVQSEPIAAMSPNVPPDGAVAGAVAAAAPSATAGEVPRIGAPPPDEAKQPIQLIDRKTGQIYLAPDREGAIAQMRAYDLDIATPGEIDWFDKNKRSGGFLDEVKTFPETVAAATAKGVAFLEQPVLGEAATQLGAPLTPEQIAPFAFTPEAKERREVNKKTALVASAVPDLVATGLVPGEGVLAMGARAVSSGIWGEAGAAAADEKPFNPMDALWFGAGAGAFEGGLHVVGGGIRALGRRAYDALGTAVERARSAALGGIAEQGAERMTTLAENSETLFAQHQASLDAAMDTIDARMGQAPDKMFTPGVLRKTVSDNVEAQADHFIGVAGQVSAAAEVTGNAELKAAADTLREALGSSNGATMYGAMRDARTALADATLENPLMRDAVQAMDESLKNESIWGKAAKNYSTVSETANTANAVGRHDIRDLGSRGPLESRLEQARAMANATGDKQLGKAISAAKKALQDADEVHGAVLMGKDQGLLGKFGQKAGEFGDKAGAFAIDNIVQNALLAASAGAGHIIGGFPGAAAGYLLGRGAYVMYGDKITAAVWQAMKREIAAKAAQNVGRTAATAAGVVGGGAIGGIPGAVAGAVAANKGMTAAERWVKNVVGSVKDQVGKRAAATDTAAQAAAASAERAGEKAARAVAETTVPREASAAQRAAHVTDIANAVSKAAGESGDKGLIEATGMLRGAVESGQPERMHEAIRIAESRVGRLESDSPLVADAKDRIAASLDNRSMWGDAARKAQPQRAPVEVEGSLEPAERQAPATEELQGTAEQAPPPAKQLGTGDKSTGDKLRNAAGLIGVGGVAASALQSDDQRQKNGLAPAAASIGLLAFFLPRMGRQVFEEKAVEAFAELTARERMIARGATVRAAERNEQLLRRFADTGGDFTFYDPLYQEQTRIQSISDLRREQLTVARDAALEHLGVDLPTASQAEAERLVPPHVEDALMADIDLRNHVLVAHDPELRPLGEVGPQRAIRGEGRGTIGNPQLRRYGLPDPAETSTAIRDAGPEGLGRTEVTGEHRSSLAPEDLPTVGGGEPAVTPEEALRHGRDVSLRATSDADLQRFIRASGRSVADTSNEAVSRLPTVEAKNAMVDAADAMRARARNLIGMQAMVPSMADSIERTVTDDVLREYGERLGRNRGEFSPTERAAAESQAQFLLHVAASDMQASRAEFRAARAAEAARPAEAAARDAAAGRGRQQSFPFAEAPPHTPTISERQYERASDAADAAGNLLEGDMPGQTSRAIGHLVENLHLPPGATEAQAMAHAHEATTQFAEQYRQLVGHAPNAREMEFARTHLAEEAGQQWSERAQRELDTRSAQQEARDLAQRAQDLREPEHTEGVHPLLIEPTPHEEERLDTLVQRAMDELEGEGHVRSDTDKQADIDAVVQRINETHGDLAPHEEIYVRRELGQEAPSQRDLDRWTGSATERVADEHEASMYTLDEGMGGGTLDQDEVVRMIDRGEADGHNGDLTPWEEHHVRRELADNETHYQRQFDATIDENQGRNQEEWERENPPESESDSEPPSSAPPSSEPESSEREPPSESGPAESGKFEAQYNTEAAGANPNLARDPHRPDGLPDRRILQAGNVQKVTMQNTNGIQNVFGRPLDMEEVKALAPFDLLRQYADESGRTLDTHINVQYNSVTFRGSAGEFSFSATYNATPDGLKLYQNGLFLPSDMQGRGIAKQIIKPMIDTLQKLGCTEVTAAATEVGKFAWPALGFRPSRGAELACVDQFGQFLQTFAGRNHPSVSEWAMKASRGTLDGTLTIRDVADMTLPIAGLEPKLATLKTSFENLQRRTGGNMEFEATFLDPEQENFRVGKSFLLGASGPWNNNLKLPIDKNSAQFKQFMFRLGLLGAAGLTTAEAAKAFSEAPLTANGVGQRAEPTEQDRQAAQAQAEHATKLIDQAQTTYETTQKMAYLQGQREQLMKRTAQAMVAPPSQQRETAVPTPGITNSVGISRFMGNQSTLAAAFQEKRDALAALQRDPMVLIQAMGEGYSELQDTDPAGHQKAVGQTYKIAQYLQSKMPETIGASLTRPEGTPVNPLAVRTFALYYSAATDPSSVLVDLQRNRAQKEQIDTLRDVWPDQYTELKTNLLSAMASQRPTFAQRQRMDLLFDFGQVLDHSLSPRLLQAYADYKQSAEGKKEEDPQPLPGGGAPTRSRMPRRQSMPSIQSTGALASLSLGGAKPVA